ncbi:unnamed protein product [Brachionus calyciflorus]|uniref:Protein kinase domain-containing protein n=1 Tax=Brachionus calyciflorus TaxID=104777 RepID=A0A813RF22_9BILA|nr:unnamed protein product [Brachionus calyciflorus]
MDKKLNDIYKEKFIAEGGFSKVYYSNDLKLKKEIVYKIGIDEKHFSKFENEYRITLALEHKNIVKCLNFYNDQELPILVLEFAQKGSLDIILLQDQLFLKNKFESIVTDITTAIQYCH